MKTWLVLLPVILCGFCGVLQAQTPMMESQKAAMVKYPQLSDAKSKLNKKFLALVAEQRATDESFLQRDDWPMKIADRAAKALGIEPKTASDDGKTHTNALDAPVGRVTIHGTVMQRMREGLLVSTQRGTVMLRGFDEKEGKMITVPAMKADAYSYIDTHGAERMADGYQALK